jgi:glycosyltransferase involved in cell wall biosynthesis
MENTNQTKLPISVIIPTYYEEKHIGELIESLNNQIMQPFEIIVADGQSKDKTREIATKLGAKVVEGGKVAFGRNAGAKVAQSEILVFMDADTVLKDRTFLGEIYLQFIKSNCDLGSIDFKANPKESTPFGFVSGSIIYSGINLVRKVESIFKKNHFQMGIFMLVKKNVFEDIGGFDEKLLVFEDSEFFNKAGNKGYTYKHLNQNVLTSTRRYNEPVKAIKSIAGTITIATLLTIGGIYLAQKSFKMYGELGGKQETKLPKANIKAKGSLKKGLKK